MNPPPPPTPASPSAKLRLICSYGGRVSTRPHNPKTVAYVGGDTRIVTINRGTSASTLASLTAHLSSSLAIPPPFALKYLLPNTNLESLISIVSDDDLAIMVDEVDRVMSASSRPSCIRLFVFREREEEGAAAEVEERGKVGSIQHPKTETWFSDALKGARMGCGGGGEGGPESVVLYTSSSFGSTSSSLLHSNLPALGCAVEESKGRSGMADYSSRENSASSGVSNPQTGGGTSYKGTVHAATFEMQGPPTSTYERMVETSLSDSTIEFKWGEKRCMGGKQREVQFYNSFLFDGISYRLYDSVYLYKEGESEPYVGKLIKIWENPDKSKKVKILWFFRPSDISNHLEGTKPLHRELFIAMGEGTGLANVNPLEAIAGKCNVVCILKDKRNPQPSNAEVEMADFVFYRAFDVGQCKIKETIDERIAGIEAKYLLNRVETGVAKVILSNKEDKRAFASHSDGLIPLTTKSTHIVKEHVKINEEALDILCEDNNTSIKVLLDDPSKLGGKGRVVEHGTYDKRPSKRAKLGKPELFKDAEEDKTIEGFDSKKASIETSDTFEDKNERTNHGESLARDKSLQRKLSDVKSPKLSIEPSFNNDDETRHDLMKMPLRLKIDKDKWFKELPWEEQLQTAQEQGTLVVLRNLDPSYTSAEVEDTVRRGFSEGCAAKMIQQSASSTPHSGEAFVILKTTEAAEKVIRELESGCLLLPNGRPLIGSYGNPYFGKRQLTFVGHMSINDPRRRNHETRDAVATSHFSQANTLEYDLAMEWRLLQQRLKLAWEKLFKRQEQELRQVRATLKPK